MTKRDAYVWFDLETTGLSVPKPGKSYEEDPDQDEIIQIAAIATGGAPDFFEKDRIELKVWPTSHGLRRMAEAYETSGFKFRFDKAEWTSNGGDPPRTAFRRFNAFLAEYATVKVPTKAGGHFLATQVAGHNVIKFDLPFLTAAMKKNSMFCKAHWYALDTLALSPWLKAIGEKMPENYKLVTLAKHMGVKLINAHDALADVEATVELGRRFTRLLGEWS